MTITADTVERNMGAQVVHNGNGANNGATTAPPSDEHGPFTLSPNVLDHVRPFRPSGTLMYADDEDWQPEADADVPMDGTTSLDSEEGGPVQSASRKQMFGKRMPIDREEIVRLMLQGLQDIGYHQAAEVLAKESGYGLASRSALDFQAAVTGGRWSEAVGLLPEMGIMSSRLQQSDTAAKLSKADFENPMDRAKFLIARQKYLEYLEASQHKKALAVLRNELAASGCPPDSLHNLSCYMMCSDREDLYKRAEWDGAAGISRRLLLERLQEDISPSVMVPSRRLASLLDQARTHQQQSCLYHDEHGSLSLYNDHQCVSGAFPSVTTHVLADHTDEVWRVEWSPDGNFLASASKDKTAVIWQLKIPASGSDEQYSVVPLHHLRAHRGPVDAIAWSPDGQVLVTASDMEIYVWDTKTGERKSTDRLVHHSDTISAIQWLPDSSQFIVSSLDCRMVFYDRSGDVLHKWAIPTLQVIDFAVTPDGTRIVAATTWLRRMPVLSKLKPTISAPHKYAAATGANDTVDFSPMDHGIAIIRIEDRDIIDFVSDIKSSEVTSLRLSHDGKRIILSCAPDELQMFAIEPHLHLVRKFVGHVQSRFLIRSGFGAPKDRFVLSGSEDGHVYVWQSNSPAPIQVLSGHTDTVNAVAWNPVLSRKLFASCSDDTEIRIWQPPVAEEGAEEGMEL